MQIVCVRWRIRTNNTVQLFACKHSETSFKRVDSWSYSLSLVRQHDFKLISMSNGGFECVRDTFSRIVSPDIKFMWVSPIYHAVSVFYVLETTCHFFYYLSLYFLAIDVGSLERKIPIKNVTAGHSKCTNNTTK